MLRLSLDILDAITCITPDLLPFVQKTNIQTTGRNAIEASVHISQAQPIICQVLTMSLVLKSNLFMACGLTACHTSVCSLHAA